MRSDGLGVLLRAGCGALGPAVAAPRERARGGGAERCGYDRGARPAGSACGARGGPMVSKPGRVLDAELEAGLTQSLLQRVAAGDRAAVRECIDRFGGLVWSLARRGGFSDAEAEDAVQEIFIELWRYAGRYDPVVASEAAFVAMISRRRLIDRRRRASRRPDQQPMPEHAAAAEAGYEGAQTSEEARRAARAMEQLAPDQQRVLRLSIMHGLSHEKIATALNMPLGTVKTHARRGLTRVREMLGALADPAGGAGA